MQVLHIVAYRFCPSDQNARFKKFSCIFLLVSTGQARFTAMVKSTSGWTCRALSTAKHRLLGELGVGVGRELGLELVGKCWQLPGELGYPVKICEDYKTSLVRLTNEV